MRLKLILLISTLSFISDKILAQTETLSTGSFIINMGATNPNTVANGLKPYGLIYDLIKNNNVPIKWVIGAGKIKDGVDFTYNAVQYRGGTFIIPAEFRSAAVNAKIATWQGQGVVGTTTISPLTVTVTQTLKAAPRWTLDAANGSIARGYLTNAGITLAAFPEAYNWKSPQTLDVCDDFFVMPHADPTWATHNNLFFWNQNALGSIWAACHAVSALENSINPGNTAQQMNFLSTRTAAVAPTPWPNNSLTLWGSHAAGSIPYTHQLFDDPVAQYLGTTDAAQLNGSEQIYLPKQGISPNNTRWRPGAKIIAYDPTQANVTAPDLANGNIAALMVYGRAFDDANRGFVMYEAGHTHNKGTAADVAAQRAFLNFSFFQVQPKAPNISVTGVAAGQNINSGAVVPVSVSATSPLVGVTFSYLWTSSCGGTFANPTSTNTTFTAPTVAGPTPCVLTCQVTDNCGRISFQSFPVVILSGPQPPVANPDNASISVTCGTGTPVTVNVLTNDADPGGLPLTLTNVTGAVNGSVSFTAAGNVTFTPNANFTGPLVLTYTVCNNATPVPLCANSTLTITTTGGSTPAVANDAFTIAEDAIGTFNVLGNDAGGLTVIGITSGPSNGRVSINTDNTITYVPNADYAGTDNFTYRVTNGSGGYNTATVTVTVTNDACDGGTYQVGSSTATVVSSNDWSKVYTRPVNTGGANLTNTVSYPINSGTNRLLVIAISAGGPNTAGVVPTVTWGGSSLTSLSVNRTDNNRAYSFIFYLKESGITAATGNNLIVNMGTPNYYGYVVYAAVYENVDQATTVRNAVSPNISSSLASPITATTTANFTANDQGIFVTGYSLNGGTSVATYSSVSSNWTGSSSLFGGATSASVSVGPYYGGVGVRSVTTAATGETVSMTVTATANLRPSITVVSIIPSGVSCATIPTRAPMAMPDTASTPNGVAVNILTATNDFFPVAGARTYSIVTPPASGNASINVTTGEITYTPTTTFNGVRSLTYQVTHTGSGLSDIATVYINITNGPIVANNDTPAGALSGTVQTINVRANDIDPEIASLDNTYPVTIVAQPANGTATIDGSGNVVYTPDAGFTGINIITYQICEPTPACGSSLCATATITVTVLNQVPIANNDSKTILPCFSNTITLIGNDTDPENGILTVTNLSGLTPGAAGTLVNNNDGTVTFNPAVGFLGVVTFTYTVTDNGVTPLVSAPATVTITVFNPPNAAPVAVNDVENTNMDQILYSSVRDNDSDPENQNLSFPLITVAPIHGTAIVNGINGLIEYTPNPGFSGTDVLTYQVCDEVINSVTCTTSPGLCTTATLTITIDPPNTVFAINDENSTWVNTSVSGSTLDNDFDLESDYPISFNGFIIAGISYSSGTQTVSGFDETGLPVANAGTIAININGTYTFTPINNFTGVINVPYSINDANLNSAYDTAYLRITVSPIPNVVNSVIANNDENRVFGGATLNSTLFSNDSDPQGNPFTVSSYSYDTNGDGNPDGIGIVGSAITVGGVTTSGKSVNNAGLLTINVDGTYTYIPAADFTGSIDLPYTICDNVIPSACATAILHIDVMVDANGLLNDPPQPGDDFIFTEFNTAKSSNFIENDSDPNSNPISLNGITINTGGAPSPIGIPVTTAQGGTVQFYSNGSYTYTPLTGYTGPDRLNYQICDVTVVNPQPLCATAMIHMLVAPSLFTLPASGFIASASLFSSSVTIKWETLIEQNTSYFIVERSLDNINFVPVGIKVTAAGNSTYKKEYQQIDLINSLLQTNIIYYRIILIDIDGMVKYSNVVIVRLNNKIGITTWPNPFQESVTINISSTENTQLKLVLVNVSGQIIKSIEKSISKGTNQIILNSLENLSSGVYILRAFDNVGKIQEAYKLIKE